MRPLLLILACLACLALTACASHPPNPSFPITHDEANAALDAMRDDPRPYDRPIVIAAGYMDPGPGCAHAATILRSLTPDPSQVIVVPFFSVSSFDACRERLINKLQAAFPSDDPARTVEVDVIGVSMGGLVALDAALPRDGALPALNIARLFTIATPHRGADYAKLPTLDSRVKSMRAGSPFLTRLDEVQQDPTFEIVAYTRLTDDMVGTPNTIPYQGLHYWLPNPPFQFAHLQAQRDARILADIARRLRNETPLSTLPPAPLP